MPNRIDVDLVFEADGHVIKRTVPIRKNKQDETGVVYVGEGGLGVKQRTPAADRWFLKSPGYAGSGYHVQVVSLNSDRLAYRAQGLKDKVYDTYERKPRK